MSNPLNEPELSNDFGEQYGLNPVIASVLSRFSRRRNRLLWLRAIAVGIVTFAVAMGIVAIIDHLFFLSSLIRAGLSLAAYIVTGMMVWWTSLRFVGSSKPSRVARQIESVDPNFREDLLSAVELADPESANGSDEFRERLQHVVSRRVAGLDVPSVLPVGILKPWLTAAALVVGIASLLFFVPHLQMGRRLARVMLVGAPIERASMTQIQIVQPDPASRYVAQGDAIAIVVDVNHVRGVQRLGDVTLEFRNESIPKTEILMTSRFRGSDDATSSDQETAADHSSQRFAANLAIGNSPTHYRVRSGDAMTLWNTLTPRPRPKVVSFTKRYLFPTYSKLGERTEESDHGDLEAISGTTAHVTVQFDQPVAEAVIKYGNRGVEFPLDPAEDSGGGTNQTYQIKVPIKTPGQYQIDAVSITSQLSNPFSPQYVISPQIDRKPIVRWGDDVEVTQLVSPMELVDLTAMVTDDLPLEEIFQEFTVSDRKETYKRVVDLESPGRELDLAWQWDLIDPTHQKDDAKEPEIRFRSGDIVTTRLVAIDRAGKRSESSTLKLLVVEEGFDSDRHNQVERLRASLGRIANWAARIEKQLVDAKDPIDQVNQEAYTQISDSLLQQLDQSSELLDSLKIEIRDAQHMGASGNLELLCRGVIELERSIRRMDARVRDVQKRDQEPWRNERRSLNRELSNRSRQLSQVAGRVEEFARVIIAHELTINVVADEMALLGSIRPLVDAGRSVPVNRFPHFMTVASSRLDALVGLIDRNHEPLPDSTSKHFDRWQAWGERWAGSLRDLDDQSLSFDQIQRRVEQFRAELEQQVRHSTLDGRIASLLQQNVRNLRNDVGFAGEQLREMAKYGQRSDSEAKQLEREKNTDHVVRRTQNVEHGKISYAARYDQLIDRLDAEESLHRSRNYVDLQYAADLNLFKHAMESVANDGYADYQDIPAATVHDELWKAFVTIESAHEVDIFRRELVQLADDEAELVDRSATRLDHPVRLERFHSGFRLPLDRLQSTGVDWESIRAVHESHYGPDYQQAASRIVKRRWSDDPLISGESSLRAINEVISSSLQDLAPMVVKARETIAKYVPSIAELAKEAAKKAEEAKSNDDANKEKNANKQEADEKEADDKKDAEEKDADSQQPESEDSKQDSGEAEDNPDDDGDPDSDTQDDAAQEDQATPEEAVDAARETIEALHDFANTSDITDQQEQDLARDADAAAEQIRRAIDEVEKSQQDARATNQEQDEKLDDLAEALRETAEHFEKAEKGEDLANSRDMLRESEQDFGIKEELEERFERAKAMAKAAQKSPEELLRQLEEELKRNPEMQKELDKIADRTSDSVQKDLEQMAKDEKVINQALERSDTNVLERKRRAAREMSMLARDLQRIDSVMLATVQNAQNWGNLGEQKETLNESRERVRKAVEKANSMGGENATLEDMKATAREVASTMKEAERQIEKVAEDASENVDEDLHKDDNARKNAKRQIGNSGSNARRQRLDQNRRNRDDWNRFANDSKRRVSDAQRREKDAQRQIDQAKKRLSKEKNNKESIQDQINKAEQRKQQAESDRKSAEQSKQFAEQRKKQTEQKRKEIESEPLPKLEKGNPAAELAEYYSDEAREDLSEMRKRLGEISKEVDVLDQLRSPASQANELSEQQQRIANDVSGAAEALRRAARHEGRLEEKLNSEQLEKAADKIDGEAKEASQQATDKLQTASEDAAQSSQASRGVKAAEEAIQASADHLENMLQQANANQDGDQDGDQDASDDGESPDGESGESAENQSAPPTGDPSTQRRSSQGNDEGSQKASQLAKTLDELDQALNSTPMQSDDAQESGESQQGESGESQQGENGGQQPGEGQSGKPQSGKPQPGQGSKPGKPQTAAEASQTLSESINQYAQQAARQRAQSMQPQGEGQQPGQQPGSQQSQNGQEGESKSGKPSDKPGQGTMPSGGNLDASDISRLGEDWGNLRSQRTDDATQGTSLKVPSQYRREIEAYFRAVAQKAGNSEAGNSKDGRSESSE